MLTDSICLDNHYNHKKTGYEIDSYPVSNEKERCLFFYFNTECESFFYPFDEFGNYILIFTHQTEIGMMENGGFRVIVDGNDFTGFLDSGNVLNGTGNADCNVKFRTYGFPGLTNLTGIFGHTFVNNHTAACPFGIHSVGFQGFSQFFYQFQIVAYSSTAARYDNISVEQVLQASFSSHCFLYLNNEIFFFEFGDKFGDNPTSTFCFSRYFESSGTGSGNLREYKPKNSSQFAFAVSRTT